jgi:hypothetical protein
VEIFEKELSEIGAEKDPLSKHLLLAALCSKVFAQRGFRLIVVGGSAVEFYTDGAYTSGDIDLCVAYSERALSVRDRQELMGSLKAEGGPRSWKVSGVYVDILGSYENTALTKPRLIQTRFGDVSVAQIEELVVEKIFVANYPSKYPPALDCARKLVAVGLKKYVEIDWNEVRRIAKLPEYGSEREVEEFIREQAKALDVRLPDHSNE